MADEKLKDAPVIPGEVFERILRNLEENMIKEERLRKGDDSFLKKSSMIDKDISQPDQRTAFIMRLQEHFRDNGLTPRVSFGDGGSVFDDPIKEIALLEGMVGLRPNNSLEAMYVEEMKDRLDYLKRLVEKDSK